MAGRGWKRGALLILRGIKTKRILLIVVLIGFVLILGSCGRAINKNLAQARAGFNTNLTEKWAEDLIVEIPHAGVLKKMEYRSSVGMLSAYITPDPNDGEKHPAIIWIFGGFGNSIDSTAWEKATADNNQSASTFREMGIVTMYPSFRGGNQNPGYQEYFFSEIDDVIAAAEYLATLPYVDAGRIYLGGHSTGGTLALLTAEYSGDLFRAVFSFGPIDKINNYGVDLPFDTSIKNEITLRSPIYWLDSIQCKTFVIEGKLNSNYSALSAMSKKNKNNKVGFYPIGGFDHFSVLKPGCDIIASKIKLDTAEDCKIFISTNDFNDMD